MKKHYKPNADSKRRYRVSEDEEKVLLEFRAKNNVGKVPSEHKAYVRKICKNQTLSRQDKLDLLSENLNLPYEDVEQWVLAMGLSLIPTQFFKAKNRKIPTSKRYIISSAQTASIVNTDLLSNMEAYAKFIGAEIGIIATRYQNPTSVFKEAGDVWSMEVDKYLTAKRQVLHPQLLLLADLKIQATAPNPTSATELFGAEKTVIVGAPKIEMKTLATLEDQHQKFIYSTGSVSAPSFTDSVAGGKAAENHAFGFIVVEIENDKVVHVRNISAQKDGSFNDLKYRVSGGHVREEAVEYLVWGDSHFAKKEQCVTDAFRGLCFDLGVERSVLHDVWDSESLNVHNVKNPVIQHELRMEGKDDLRKELDQMYSELDWFEKNMKETLIVASNHDDMLDRAMYQGDWRDNPTNAKIFVEMLGLTINGLANDGLIPYYVNKRYNKVRALSIDDSIVRYDTELGQHGHRGSNGSKGSILQFSKWFMKTIIGHSHTAGIKGGCYSVGHSSRMDHKYNKGMSSWTWAGCTLNKHGKRQIIVFNKKSLSYTTLY